MATDRGNDDKTRQRKRREKEKEEQRRKDDRSVRKRTGGAESNLIDAPEVAEIAVTKEP